uniref:Uncharacterized protein n=1 Tax=Alexandrium catenella TaxID=2925 RepID=A0A7S1S4D9_ALECA|mmetsp:Transcript_85691/g.227684  ORF Transcript_85691/g.227684 Transcript_85691/m.227684 type:complete len:616 (+) Transcript_85691:68-1915(+)|eukprot:CAMPEP_0171201804 /NCGR_PEP_ID=MMETSP0790-20130122/24676_1 /TAXON_ID=2925 /ORGANISM="Alexandrium catenella, Strain OF101" /LENGTH=615 /DNA_ID=CAMNT_0011667209 /DNA_START=49 /DNA_END=1896 /DNA_ORIENTATION=-
MATGPLALVFQDSPQNGLSEQLHLSEFPLDERAAEFVPGPEEGHSAVLESFDDQYALVKTVKNDGWVPFICQLQGGRMRTSLTLPPPGGRSMKLFGKYSRVGLIFDRRALDLSDAHIWPSGYFAKSDFNIDSSGNLLNGREEALVTLEELILANQTLTYVQSEMGGGDEHPAGNMVTGGIMPFNEILGLLDGTQGLVGVFSRSTKVTHLLFAMGIRSLLYRTLPITGMLPIFVHDPELGMRPFSRKAQSALVSDHLMRHGRGLRSAVAKCALPCLPLDTHMLELSELEQVVAQGVYAITEDALTALVNALLNEDHSDELQVATVDGSAGGKKACPYQTRAFLALGLRAAVEADNPTSAMALVRRVAPLLVTAPVPAPSRPLSLTLDRTRSNELLPIAMDGEDFATYLHRLTERSQSSGVLVPVGAAIVIEEFTSGHMMPRILAACQKLEAWLQDSKSVIFRLRSWSALKGNHVPSAGPDIKSFVSHKAISNRKQFYQSLLELQQYEESHDVLHGMTKLYALVSSLHHPCMRLELLQQILGLDDRYNLEAVAGVASLALEVVSDALHFGGPAPANTQVLSPSNSRMAPDFQLEAAARRMQGLDREDKPLVDGLLGA